MSGPWHASFEERLDLLRERIQQPDFLANRGLGNELGFYVFQYDPHRELDLRRAIKRLKASQLGCRIVERNLWDVFCGVCASKGILDRIPSLEERRGTEGLLRRLQTIVPPEVYVAAMDYTPHEPGDVLFITGVGQVFPLVRAHAILENAHHVFEDVPTVLFYPGAYDQVSLTLFGVLNDSNYYRAFDLI